MTDRPCPLDGVPLGPDEYICRGCGGATRGRLRAVPDLLDELDTSLARTGSSWREPGGIRGQAGTGTCPRVEGTDGQLHPCSHAPDSPTCIEGAVLGMNLGASEAAMQLRIVLHGWSRIFDEESPIVVDPDLEQPEADARRCTARRERDRALAKSGTQALLLADQALAGRVWAPDLAAEIRDAVRQAERVIDRPPDLTLIGACACGMSIYAAEGETTVRCRWCGARHDTLDLHARALAGAHDALESATVISRAIVDPVTRKPICTASMIRGWRHRGSLDVAGVNDRGQPLYRVSDVERLIRDGAPGTVDAPGESSTASA